ncbi:LIMR family protein [Cryptosporidium felis]|nr:LIMR family protein [Cryptosporidium felis]
MDFILICFIIFYNVIALFVNLRFIYVFEDTEDSKAGFFKQALFSRIVAIAGLQLLWLNFMLVPANIINEYPIMGSQGVRTVNIVTLFMTIMYMNIIFTSLVIPFSIFYYENQFDHSIGLKKSYLPYVFSLFITMVCWILIAGNYGVFREIKLGTISNETCLRLSNLGYLAQTACSDKPISFNGTFSITTAGLLLLLGYIFNVIFVGVGCILIPLGFMNKLLTKPKPLESEAYNNKKREIYLIARALSQKGEELKKRNDESSKGLESDFFSSTYFKSWQNKRTVKQKIYKYRSEVIALNSYFELLEGSLKTKTQDFFFTLILSLALIFSLLMSASIITTFILQITLKNSPTYSGQQLINMLFIIYSLILPVYIGICVCYTWNFLAEKICYCFPIHKLKASETPMNSLIFVIGIVLIPVTNITYIANLSNSWLFESDLNYVFLLASSTKLNSNLIPNQVLVYSTFGVSFCSLVIYMFSYLWDNGSSVQKEVPKILNKYLSSENSKV